MRVTIKNEVTSVVLSIKYFETVARLKSKYQESGKVYGRPDYIVLLFKGKELDDETTLGEQGISNGSVIIHIESSHDPYHGINYRQMADSLAIQHRHMDENLKMLRQEDIWAPDSKGTVRSLGLDHSIVRTDTTIPSPVFTGRTTGSSRSFFNQISVSVNALIYHVLPRMEGRWNGEMTVLPASQPDATQVCASEISFREEERVWSQRRTETTINGITTTHHYWFKPVADGVLKIETDDSALRACNIMLQEQGNSMLLLTGTSIRTGKIILVETVVLIDSSRRLRTVQRFDESGAFRCVSIMNERRVMDAVSGALEKYHGQDVRSRYTSGI